MCRWTSGFAQYRTASRGESTVMATFATLVYAGMVKSSTDETTGDMTVTAIIHCWNVSLPRLAGSVGTVATLAIGGYGCVYTRQERGRRKRQRVHRGVTITAIIRRWNMRWSCIRFASGVETIVTRRTAINNIRVINRRTSKGHRRMTDSAIICRRYVITNLTHCDHIIMA